jgi:hypothetical protein
MINPSINWEFNKYITFLNKNIFFNSFSFGPLVLPLNINKEGSFVPSANIHINAEIINLSLPKYLTHTLFSPMLSIEVLYIFS